jgi:hypothetical protein
MPNAQSSMLNALMPNAQQTNNPVSLEHCGLSIGL